MICEAMLATIPGERCPEPATHRREGRALCFVHDAVVATGRGTLDDALNGTRTKYAHCERETGASGRWR